MRETIRFAIALAIVTIIASGGLGITYAATKDRIERQRFIEQMKAAQAVLPIVKSVDDFTEETALLEDAQEVHPEVAAIFRGEVNGAPAGYAIQVQPRGYGGPMKVVVGVDLDGSVTGVQVVEHKETPGLGTEIVENIDYIAQYLGRVPSDPVVVGEDIDAVSGATISAEGLTDGVRMALDVYEKVLQ